MSELSKQMQQFLLAAQAENSEELMAVLIKGNDGEANSDFVDFIINQALVPEMHNSELFRALIPKVEPTLEYKGQKLCHPTALQQIFDQIHKNRSKDNDEIEIDCHALSTIADKSGLEEMLRTKNITASDDFEDVESIMYAQQDDDEGEDDEEDGEDGDDGDDGKGGDEDSNASAFTDDDNTIIFERIEDMGNMVFIRFKKLTGDEITHITVPKTDTLKEIVNKVIEDDNDTHFEYLRDAKFILNGNEIKIDSKLQISTDENDIQISVVSGQGGGAETFKFPNLKERIENIIKDRQHNNKGFDLSKIEVEKFIRVALSGAVTPAKDSVIPYGPKKELKSTWSYDGNQFYQDGEKAGVKTSYNGISASMMTDCLLNDDIEGLNNCVREMDSGLNTLKIEDLHPLIAVRTLEKFGFEVNNKNGRREVQNVNDWLNNVVGAKMGIGVLQKIKKDKLNNNIIKFLDLLVDFVNTNSDILNKGNVPSQQKQLLPLIPMSSVITGLKQKLQTDKHMLGFGNYQAFNLPFLPFMAASPDGQSSGVILQGGGDEVQTGARYMKNIFENAFDELKSNNKDIVRTDKQKILKRLDNVINEEDEIMKNLSTIRVFGQLKSAFNGHDSNILSKQNMDKLVDRQKRLEQRKNKQERSLVAILETMSKI